MRRLFSILFFLIIINQCFSQTHTITYDVNWRTAHQNMWGPNGTPFDMDTIVNLYDINEHDTTTAGSITQILGGDFGVELTLGYWLRHGVNFTIEGFTTGFVDAYYPTTIDLTFPNNNSFNPGQTITIGSSYTVDPDNYLHSFFPNSGSMSLDLYFGFHINVDANVCVWSCTNIPILNVGVPLDTTNLIHISDSNGIADVTYPWYDPAIGFYMAHDTIIPIVFNNLGGIGLSGVIGIPYVETNHWLDPTTKCVNAKGDSAYMHFDLDIIQFLSAFDSSWAAVLSMLNGHIDLGLGITIDYSLLTAHLVAASYMHQNYNLCPTIWATLDFPQPLDYFVTDPSMAIVDSGSAASIKFKVDNALHVTYPCVAPPSMDIDVKFAMDNTFRNHTWDSVAFTFVLTAFTFVINLPSFPVAPDVCIPEMCLEVPVPCPEDYGSGNCSQTICSSEICMGLTELPQTDQTITIGPLIDLSLPLGYIPITWFDRTWELAGFRPDQGGHGDFDTIVPGTTIIPNPPFETSIDGPNVICYGDTVATITVTVTHGTPPYTYNWSTGQSHTTTATADSIVEGVGSYSCTITDASGCVSTESLTILYINPQLFSTVTGTDIMCHGDSTGQAIVHATGGTPGYTYNWNPYGGHLDTANHLCAGTYIVEIIDAVTCNIFDTIKLIELHPLPPVNFISDKLDGCQPLVVQFNELSPNENQTYSWTFGDGGTDTIKNPQHIYTEYGTYDVSLTVVSVWGCDSTMSKPAMITVYPKPVADFTATPELILATIDSTFTIHFTDNSTFATAWNWNFSDPNSGSGTSILQDPVHSFSNEGLYNVTLIAISNHGCTDTITKRVELIDDRLKYENVFTPNGDGYNDYFEVKNCEKYPENKLIVFDRWGVKIFEKYHYRNDWNADGISDGTYYFIFDPMKTGFNPVHGSVTILR
jgi:gliding motility-associated-like protein